MRASRSGLPISAVMSCAIRSARASIASAAFMEERRALAGAAGRDHAGNAASRRLDGGAGVVGARGLERRPSPRDGRQGFRFSYVSPERPSRHSPAT